jgi:hypothetical protein
MANCRNCEKEIVKVEGERMRRFYCSFTCYDRWTSKVKYSKNIEKSRQKSKDRSSKPETKERYILTINSHKKWCKAQGLTITQYREYGFTFLKDNPDVVEVLKLLNEINSNKRTEDEIKEYNSTYYQKNKEVIKEQSRQRRLKLKTKNYEH